MELKNLFTEERAVSPVIAVVLMIAVTVILAAIVAAFALGLGGGGDTTPQASFDFDYDGANTVAVTHEGGDTIPDGETVDVLVEGTDVYTFTSPVSTGSTVDINGLNAGDEIRVKWTGEDGQTTTLAVYKVPEQAPTTSATPSA